MQSLKLSNSQSSNTNLLLKRKTDVSRQTNPKPSYTFTEQLTYRYKNVSLFQWYMPKHLKKAPDHAKVPFTQAVRLPMVKELRRLGYE